MGGTDLIFSGAHQSRFAAIALAAGFRYGAQLPNTVHAPPFFVDQDWRAPRREQYIDAVKTHRPALATVLDWEREEQLPEVLGWAEAIAAYVTDAVIIIPKVAGSVSRLPRVIGGRAVRLGYSVPTKFGGTEVPAWEFAGWPVHLLGGQPHTQLRLSHYLDVRSVDGNYARLKAVKYCEYWANRTGPAGSRLWSRVPQPDGPIPRDVPYIAFTMSCHNIIRAWQTRDAMRA